MGILLGLDDDPTFVTATDGTVSFSPGTPITSSEEVVADQPLSTALYSDTDVAHSPAVAPGMVSLLAELVSDPDGLYAPAVTAAAAVEAALYDEPDALHAPSIEATAQAAAGFYSDPDGFHASGIEGGEPGYTLTGSPATFSITPVTVTVGYTLTGFDVEFSITPVAVTMGYVLTGFDVSFVIASEGED